MTSERIPHPHLRDEASTDALPVSPALGASLDAARMPRRSTLVEPRVLFVCALAMLLGVAAAFIARILVALISVMCLGSVSFLGSRAASRFSRIGASIGH